MADVLQALRDWLSPVVLPILGVIYTWIKTNDRDNAEQIKAVASDLGDKISAHDDRLNQLSGRVESLAAHQVHLPTHGEVTDIKERLARLESTAESQGRSLESLATDVRATRGAIETVRDFLMAHPIPKGKS